MSRTCCYTSFTYAYLARARVLCDSLRRAHPDWPIHAVVVDEPPPGVDPAEALACFDGVIPLAALGIPRLRSWLFKHDVVEACTAVKGHALLHLLERHDKVVYFDPDIALFHPLDDLETLLDRHSIVLTPHQLDANEAPVAIADNELTSLRYGVFNLGFLAVRSDPEGRRFAAWWAAQLLRACYDEVENGIFTDQKYCDLVPALFERVHVHRDPGCNVASWNLSRRTLRIGRDGAITANNAKLKFYHFTKIGTAGDVMVRRYAGPNLAVFEIWEWYRRQIAPGPAARAGAVPWHYGQFADGRPIPKSLRLLFRGRADLLAAFDDPFRTGPGSYIDWVRSENPELLSVPAAA